MGGGARQERGLNGPGDVRLQKGKKCLLIGRRGTIATLSRRAREAGGRRATGAWFPPATAALPRAPGRRNPATSPVAAKPELEALQDAGSGISESGARRRWGGVRVGEGGSS